MAFFFIALLMVGFGVLLRWNEMRYRKKGLPPGTMGWPLFGETTEFLKQGPSFMKNQKARIEEVVAEVLTLSQKLPLSLSFLKELDGYDPIHLDSFGTERVVVEVLTLSQKLPLPEGVEWIPDSFRIEGVVVEVLTLTKKSQKTTTSSIIPEEAGWIPDSSRIEGVIVEILTLPHPRSFPKERDGCGMYGSFFKSHILGCPTIVSMDAEVNRYILANESKGLVPGYPQSMLDILGKCNIAAVHGSAHKYMRGALLSLISPTMIKHHLLPKIDEFMSSHVSTWDHNIIDIQEKTNKMAFLSSLKQIAGVESSSIAQEFMPEFFNLVLGTLSLPINLPNTNYRRGLQARVNIVSLLRKLIEARRDSQEKHQDILGFLMNKEENRYKLKDDEMIDLIITILYSGYETVSTTSMMAVKYLHDHPKVIEELRKEHMGIRERKVPNDPIDYSDYKSMRFTRAVIFETSRLATIVNGVLRKTTRDIDLNGFLIPKGWRIYVYTREVNYDPRLYPDPYTFNPWRWLNMENQNHSMIFGGGSRQCPGKELGMAEISTFLHYFVTRYRWEEVGGDRLMKFPRVEAPNGLHFRVSSYQPSLMN